jgi:penicillin-binding protein 1A
MTSMLRDVVDHGTGFEARRSYRFTRPAAGKTGTTNEYTDAWFVGYTPQITSGVWVGFDDKRISLGERQSGAVIAVPIWAPFMKAAHDTLQLPVEDFPTSGDVVWVNICDDSKQLAGDHCPKTRFEVFRKDLAPQEKCTLHASPDADLQKQKEDVY